GGILISLIWLGGNMLITARATGRSPIVRTLDNRLNINLRDQTVALGWIGVILVSLIAGFAVGSQWQVGLDFLNGSAFGKTDPVFGQDIGFYVFRWPFLQLLANWVLWLVGFALFGVAIIRGSEQIDTRRIKLDAGAIVHLTLLAALFLAVRAWEYHLQRYDILYSVHGALHGAGYTDINVSLPAYNILSIVLLAASALMLVNIYLRKLWPVWIPLAVWLVVSFLMLDVAPSLVQRLLVTPDELAQERPYIERSITFTRQAFGLDAIQETPFAGTQALTYDDLDKNKETITNIRLWDWQPLQRTYSQLQEIRTYYEFGDVDVERYELEEGPRSVMLAAREMRTDQLVERAKTWLNEHLIYTHGHGLVLNAVNKVTEDGLPQFLVRDIPPRISDPALAIDRPEIYFGESSNDYVIVGAMEDELDYPQGDTNVYTRYEGSAGVQLKNIWRRLAFSIRFGDLPVLISQSITRDSRVLMYRSIQDRIDVVAPFLWLDEDPYLVISQGRLYWFQDAYTYTERFPYSDNVEWSGRVANYVRNSVKIVIDAYNGNMTFYASDPDDPILKTYSRIYPNLFTSIDEMPAEMRQHIRYPQDLFTIQAQMYLTYHMRDTQVFYNREDLWQQAIEVRGSQETPVEPYFVIMSLPDKPESEFMLMLPLTPAGKDNMIAWLYADSDGEDYGEMGVLQFSKQELIYGPRQVEARIDQDPVISQQLSLWNQRGSQVIRGNMMVIPIEKGLLYVEPVFLQAESGRLPELKRIIVVHGSQIAMGETLADALVSVFSGQAPAFTEPIEGTEEQSVPTGSIAELVKIAQEHYDAAQQCLAKGDWACYGQEQENLSQTLQALLELTEQ
ncbi:MAG: UPF0182 family protein, partial [Anaerolineales bacterium]|nr:UPF0182 family protein [Anaerolineales bacterium]